MENERPTPKVEDIEGTRKKLQRWLAEKLGADGDVTIPNLDIPEATGMSNVTLLFEARYEKDGNAIVDQCVGRLQPAIARPVFPEYDLSVQYRAMDIVGRETDIPVPELMGLETDNDVLGTGFYVMKRIDGRVPPDMPPYNMDGWLLNEATVDQRKNLWNAGISTMAHLHKQTENAKAMGFDFLDQPELGVNPLQQQLAYWERYLDWALDGTEHSVVGPALDWLKNNQPQNERFGLSWGDSRVGNMLFSQDCTKVNAVLDWEMIKLGNPIQDLAWWNHLDHFFAAGLGMPRLEGLPSYEASIALWEKESGFTCSQSDYQYYWIFAGMRYGAILSRISYAQNAPAEEVQRNLATNLLAAEMEKI